MMMSLLTLALAISSPTHATVSDAALGAVEGRTVLIETSGGDKCGTLEGFSSDKVVITEPGGRVVTHPRSAIQTLKLVRGRCPAIANLAEDEVAPDFFGEDELEAPVQVDESFLDDDWQAPGDDENLQYAPRSEPVHRGSTTVNRPLQIEEKRAEARYAERTPPAAPATPSTPAVTTPLDLTLVTPVALIPRRDTSVLGLSVNFLYGNHLKVQGLEVGLVNRERYFGGVNVAAFSWVDELCMGVMLGGATVCRDGIGVQASLVSVARDRFVGLQVGAGANYVEEGTLAFQISLTNLAQRTSGAQLGLINNCQEDFTGLQVSMANLDGQDFGEEIANDGVTRTIRTTFYPSAVATGLFIGVGNVAQNLDGVQLGAFNVVAHDAEGAQISLVNYSSDVRGAQIGAINIARTLNGVQLGLFNLALKNKLPFMLVANVGL